MKKKGFTLIELIAVIAILSVILIISVPNLIGNIKRNKADASNTVEGIVLTAGRNYVVDYGLKYPATIPIEELCNGYIECPIINASNTEITGYIAIDEDNNYTIVDDAESTLVVNYNGGSSGQVFESSYEIWEKVILEEPTKYGYTFDKWVVIRGNGRIKKNVVIVGDRETEIYALWTSWPLLTVDLDEGVTTQTFEDKYATRSNIELQDPTREGYEFNGWEVVSGNSLLSGSTLTIGTKNTTVRAKWIPNTYTITLTNSNATTNGSTSATVKYDGDVTNITAPKRKYTITYSAGSSGATLSKTSDTAEFIFTGWYTAESGGSRVINSSGKLENSVAGYTDSGSKWIRTSGATLYAQWDSVSLTAATLTKTGNVCGYTNGVVSGGTFTPTGTMTLTAQCNTNSYSCAAGTYLKAGETTCSDCPAGSACPGGNFLYSATTDVGRTPCAAGYYTNGTKKTQCTQCATGSYAAGTGNTSCTACAAGKTTNGLGTSSSSCVSCTNSEGVSTWGTQTWNANSVSNLCSVSKCNGGYRKNGTTSCIKCSAGYYSAGGTATSCTKCTGANTSAAGASSCTVACSNRSGVSTWSSSATCTIVECNAGYKIEDNECVLDSVTCSAGQYLPANTLTCSGCPAGYRCPGGTFNRASSDQGKFQCTAGTYAAANSSSCSTCTGNKTSNAGASSCTVACSNSTGVSEWSTTATCTVVKCNGGYRKNGNACTQCSAGTYSAGGTATTCSTCTGANTSAAGASSCTVACTNSAGVHTWSTTATCTATKCSAGYYLNGKNCTKCTGSKTTTDGNTSTSCGTNCSNSAGVSEWSTTATCTVVKCNAGYRKNGNACTQCGAGTYSTGGTATACSTCTGANTSAAGASSCTVACTNSTGVHTWSSSATCTATKCNAGYYLNGKNCTKCATGMGTTSGNTSTSCTANTYTITYNANGGSGAPSAQSYTYATSGTINLSSTKPTRDGYTFLGWNQSNTATSAQYTAGQAWNKSNANNYTLYAVWKENVLTLKIHVNGAATNSSGTAVSETVETSTYAYTGSVGYNWPSDYTPPYGYKLVRAGYTGSGVYHVGSATATTTIAQDYIKDSGGVTVVTLATRLGILNNLKAGNYTLNLYAGWTACSNKTGVYAWSTTTACTATKCNAGYYLNSGSCTACGKGTTTSAGNTASSCSTCSNSSSVYSYSSGCTAASCKAGYYLSSGSCVACGSGKSSPAGNTTSSCYNTTGTLAQNKIWGQDYRKDGSSRTNYQSLKQLSSAADGSASTSDFSLQIGGTYKFVTGIKINLPQPATQIRYIIHGAGGGASVALKYKVSEGSSTIWQTDPPVLSNFNTGSFTYNSSTYTRNDILISYTFKANTDYWIYFYCDPNYYATMRFYRRAQNYSAEVTYGLNATAPSIAVD